MWSEFVDASNFIPREWPRTAAVAERAWANKDVRDVTDARGRLHEFRCKLLARGIIEFDMIFVTIFTTLFASCPPARAV